jgi:hypothetical protein
LRQIGELAFVKRKLLEIIVTYATSAGLIWGAVEAYTYFEGEELKLLIGQSWPLLFIVFPGVLAVIAWFQIDRDKSQEERNAETELLLAVRDWWGSISDYERSGAEMTGSASNAGLMPRNRDMGTQLGCFEVVKIKTWPFLSKETKRIAKKTEETFLGFMAGVYSGMYNHEVYGGLVPVEVVRNRTITETILGQENIHTFSECEQAYRVLQAHLKMDSKTERQYQQPIIGRIQPHISLYSMYAVDRRVSQRFFNGVRAYPLDTVGLTFDVTNPNNLDMRLIRFFVDVVEFIDVNILRVNAGAVGGGAIIHNFICEIGSVTARYKCIQVSNDFDYIRLSSGEMETFRIDVMAPREGVYRLMVALEYSIAGKSKTIEVDNDIQEIGFFDPTYHRIYNVSAGMWETE